METDLVRRAIAGDAGARDDLMEWSLPRALAWCARLGGPRVDAEDAAHDALMIVWTKLPTLSDPARYTAWLYGIVRRVLASHRRRAFVRRWAPGVSIDREDTRPGGAVIAQQNQLADQVELALEKLPDKQREVLVLCELEQRTDLEVSELLGVPVGTVKSRLRLGRARFAQVAARMRLQELLPGRPDEE